MNQKVLFEVDENIAKIILNREDVLNALDEETLNFLNSYLDKVFYDDKIRCVILTGKGKAFCVGADLKYIRSFLDKGERFPYGEFLDKLLNKVVIKIASMYKPVIAAINGVVAGAGIGLALCCDYKIAVENANFVEAFLNVGLIPDTATCFYLIKNMPFAKVLEFLTTGSTLSANEALKYNLVNKVVKMEEFEGEVMKQAKIYSELPTVAIGLAKRLAYYSLNENLERVLELESYLQEVASHTEDHKEGLEAFIKKRKPVFKGK